MKDSFRIIDSFLPHSPVVDIENLPQEMQSLANEISQIEDEQTAIRYAYDTLSKKYRGFRMLTFFRLDRFLITNISTLWKIRGFLHCNHLNYLLRTLLVTSKKFFPTDIEACWTQIWLFSPHQYLNIKLSNGMILSIDLWGKVYGIPFGKHAHGFQGGSIMASTQS
ncbi:MAG: hypothetical protein WBC29_01570 [Candidatus Moraniibacteriota bacterium]